MTNEIQTGGTATIRGRRTRVNNCASNEAKSTLRRKVFNHVLPDNEPPIDAGSTVQLLPDAFLPVGQSGPCSDAPIIGTGNLSGDRPIFGFRQSGYLDAESGSSDISVWGFRCESNADQQQTGVVEHRGETSDGQSRPRGSGREGAMTLQDGFSLDVERIDFMTSLDDPLSAITKAAVDWSSTRGDGEPDIEACEAFAGVALAALEQAGYPVTCLFNGQVQIYVPSENSPIIEVAELIEGGDIGHRIDDKNRTLWAAVHRQQLDIRLKAREIKRLHTKLKELDQRLSIALHDGPSI